MADLPTTNYNWTKPENGASLDSWGIKWNDNLDDMDSDLKAVEEKADAAQDTANLACVKSQNLNDLTDKAAARVVLGAQASHVNLTAFSGIPGGSDTLPYFNGSGSMTYTGLSSYGRTLIDDANAGAARATLGIPNITNTGVYVQSSDPGGADGTVWMW